MVIIMEGIIVLGIGIDYGDLNSSSSKYV